MGNFGRFKIAVLNTDEIPESRKVVFISQDGVLGETLLEFEVVQEGLKVPAKAVRHSTILPIQQLYDKLQIWNETI